MADRLALAERVRRTIIRIDIALTRRQVRCVILESRGEVGAFVSRVRCRRSSGPNPGKNVKAVGVATENKVTVGGNIQEFVAAEERARAGGAGCGGWECCRAVCYAAHEVSGA